MFIFNQIKSNQIKSLFNDNIILLYSQILNTLIINNIIIIILLVLSLLNHKLASKYKLSINALCLVTTSFLFNFNVAVSSPPNLF